ncbi:mannose-P-dolichol utilization defect 1 protein [Tilletiaria anomala UBC 951]|uniref:Mannose-P-dolichol utilization defect 1 protein homolog n=1 Tax=Tilletiaria anomala (strain ATCC 24038 / CBS 436.72 / UBC 951) TaxID=1037660 RepID=A0A066WQN9_TILAU|nr:mannose-P-dolichol utilization defect 1 protein [Tilletiaria anomala UBC 951]KDN52950.1 mannose-P-dolichol utilization defect 1 protein [Tilletiaria anomala UBC 951]
MAQGSAAAASSAGWQHAAQRFTRNLPALVRDPAVAVLGQVIPECYTKLVYNIDLSSKYCLHLALSKSLGLGIVVFGSIMKVPQILKIVNSRSARGISLSMYILEVLAYTISLAYAYRRQIPFSTYGENASLTVQNMVITLLIIAYSPVKSLPASSASATKSRRSAALLIAATLMALLSLFLFTPSLCSISLLSLLQAMTIPISLMSKVPQILELHRRKAPGQLSSIVVFAQLLGTVARVFTTLTETDDALLFWGFALATVFNAVIAVQLVMYWNGNDKHAPMLGGEKDNRKLD